MPLNVWMIQKFRFIPALPFLVAKVGESLHEVGQAYTPPNHRIGTIKSREGRCWNPDDAGRVGGAPVNVPSAV